jgi:hypothetical protein
MTPACLTALLQHTMAFNDEDDEDMENGLDYNEDTTGSLSSDHDEAADDCPAARKRVARSATTASALRDRVEAGRVAVIAPSPKAAEPVDLQRISGNGSKAAYKPIASKQASVVTLGDSVVLEGLVTPATVTARILNISTVSFQPAVVHVEDLVYHCLRCGTTYYELGPQALVDLATSAWVLKYGQDGIVLDLELLTAPLAPGSEKDDGPVYKVHMLYAAHGVPTNLMNYLTSKIARRRHQQARKQAQLKNVISIGVDPTNVPVAKDQAESVEPSPKAEPLEKAPDLPVAREGGGDRISIVRPVPVGGVKPTKKSKGRSKKSVSDVPMLSDARALTDVVVDVVIGEEGGDSQPVANNGDIEDGVPSDAKTSKNRRRQMKQADDNDDDDNDDDDDFEHLSPVVKSKKGSVARDPKKPTKSVKRKLAVSDGVTTSEERQKKQARIARRDDKTLYVTRQRSDEQSCNMPLSEPQIAVDSSGLAEAEQRFAIAFVRSADGRSVSLSFTGDVPSRYDDVAACTRIIRDTLEMQCVN